MGRPRASLQGLGKVVDWLTDNRVFDLLVGNWFDKPLDNYLDRSNCSRGPRRRVYLDAEGNRIQRTAPE